MTEGAGGETLLKGQKNRNKQQREYAEKLTERAGKSVTTVGENAEISAKKALKEATTESSKMLQKYKF